MNENQKTNEILDAHEPFFVDDVSVFSHKIFCGDERKPLTNETYIHVFGGAANAAYNAEILARITENGVQHINFKNSVANAAKDLANSGIAAGVHSDTHCEAGNQLDPNGQTEIGCGYIKLRRAISQQIAENPDEIVAEAEQLRPELFTGPSDTSFGHAVVKCHASLADNDEFFGTSSREVATAAINEKAPSMLVGGEHTAREGIINLHHSSTINSLDAFENNQSIYVHDAWASTAIAKQYDNAKNFSSHEWQITDLIDAIGTMWALGVKTIVVRR